MESRVGSSRYDVFINFRGEDTRNSFVGYLYKALTARGIEAFMDGKDLLKGDRIGELLEAIKVSDFSIAVFSDRYVESKWCLHELAQMMECHRTNNQIIFPIFFKVKTSDVKNQTGCFEILPQTYGDEVPETLQKWKDALRVVGDTSGWVVNDGDDESELVEEVVQIVWNRLKSVPLEEVEHRVGLESRIKYVSSLLSNTSSKDVRFLGICGPGGIGKTTIAIALYNHMFRDFNKSVFIENVGQKASQPDGIVALQKILFERISGKEIKISSSREGSSLIKKRLGKIDTLLILDDVSHRDQLKALAAHPNWFGPKSKIVITTRDQNVLSGLPEQNRTLYEPEALNEEDSLQLFNSYAFPSDQPPNDYMQLSVDIVSTTGGLPLALEVLGSDLSLNKDKEFWKSMYQRLTQILHDDVYEKLKISFDNLHDIEKIMFLDAACFFREWSEETVISIWEACGFEPRLSMEVLKRKSLLKINELKKLWMHDQIQDMGRTIVYNQNPMEPHKRSRLWSCDIVMKLLKGGKGSEIVEGIQLSFRSIENSCLYTSGFEKMPKLRLLQVDGATLKGSFECLPSRLRWLRWRECSLDEIPADFYHEELIMLDLSHSGFKHAWNCWPQNKLFQQLKVLKLSWCSSLSESPDFSGFPCLERLCLDNSNSLVNLHESIGQLKNLVYLNLEACSSLKELPNSICRLSSLQKLILNYCTSLNKVPESIGNLKESLVELLLKRTNIEALPDGVGLLEKLEVLDLSHCDNFVNLPMSMENMTSLRYVELTWSNKPARIPKLPSSLIQLRIYCGSMDSRPHMELLEYVQTLLMCPEDLAKTSIVLQPPDIYFMGNVMSEEINMGNMIMRNMISGEIPCPRNVLIMGNTISGEIHHSGDVLIGNMISEEICRSGDVVVGNMIINQEM